MSKSLLAIVIALMIAVIVDAQVERVINVPYTSGASPTDQALLLLPSDYATSPGSYPLLVFCHSASEAADGASAGTGLAKIYNQASYGGPSYFIEHGSWPASFRNPITGLQEQFIVVSPQAKSWSFSGDQLAYVINYLVANYRIDTNRIHITGVSAGGGGVAEYAAQLNMNETTPSLNVNVRKWKPADIIPMSEATNRPTQTWANIVVADSIYFWGFGDMNGDLYGGFTYDFSTLINRAKSGYARFTSFSTGHGPWNPFYNPGRSETFTWKNINTSYSIYTWMLANSRASAAPVANAGAPQTITLPLNTVTLNGSASTGNITSYRWQQLSGPTPASITTPLTITTTVTGMVQGIYIFQLTVNGISNSSVQITVNPAPPPPVANAGAPQTITLPTNSVTLNGSASTGNITSYIWTQISGPSPVALTTPTSVSTNATGLIQGSYIFQLALNGGSTSTVTITVNPEPIIANAGVPQTITLPTSQVTLNGTASTGIITSYSWQQLSGPASAAITTPDEVTSTVTGLGEGVYIFQLTVNGISNSSVQITVNPAPPPPIANAGAPQTITLPANSVTLSSSSSTGIITSYSWTQLSGPSAAVLTTPTSVSTNATGLVQGDYIFQIVLNGGSTAIVVITVDPQPVIANAGPDQTISLPTSEVLLNGSASTGIVSSYNWQQLSGPASANIITPTAALTTVTGLVQGIYVFQLTVNDGSTANVQITVTHPPLIADAGISQTIILPVSQATLNGAASSGLVISDKWAEISGPSSAAFAYDTAVTTLVSGLIQGVYIFKLTVTDDQNTISSDTMSVTVSSAITIKMINVNIYGGTNPYTNTQWNNWNVNPSINSPAFLYADGTSSGVAATLTINEGVVDNSATYGGTMAPAAVLRYSSFCEVTRTLTITGLKTNLTYNIELYASRNSNSGQKTIFQIAGQVPDTILTYRNLTNKAVFTGLKPNAQGNIVITISTPTGYNYLNGLAITELTGYTSQSGGGDAIMSITQTPEYSTADSSVVKATDFALYPNPSQDHFILVLNSNIVGKVNVKLTDASGIVRRTFEFVKDFQICTNNITINNLPGGIYFVTVQIGNWKATHKILKL
jgi:hypothetical protein